MPFFCQQVEPNTDHLDPWSNHLAVIRTQDHSPLINHLSRHRSLWPNEPSLQSLSAKIKYLTMTDAKKVWMPDTFFRNEKEGRFHNILVPNVYIRIFPNGDVLYSIR